MSLSVSLCRSVQWIPPFWSKVLSACRNSPSCILPKASFCSASLTRCTSFKVAAPWVCRNVSNMPPRSMLESCLSSPARMSFAPASRAAAATRASSFVEIIAASSTIKTVSRVPARPAFLKRVQFAGEGVRLLEAVAAHLLRYVVRPGQAAHVLAGQTHRRRASRSGCGSCRFRPRPTAWQSPRPG